MLWCSFPGGQILTVCLLVNSLSGISIHHSSDHIDEPGRVKRANLLPHDGAFNMRNLLHRKGRGMHLIAGIQRNCTTNCGMKNFNALFHMKKLKYQISRKLGRLTNSKGIVQSPFDTTAKRRESDILQKDREKKKPIKKETFIREFSEIISFSEKAGNVSERGVLSFTIDVTNNPGPLEALSAHLWILIHKRRRWNHRGKKIFLEVLKIDDTQGDEVLTSLITRVRKPRWQKVNLPVTFIQSLLDSNKRTLKLRITCRKCGKVVRLVLGRKRNNLKRKKQQKTVKSANKNAPKDRKRLRARKLRSKKLQNRRSRKRERMPPFLVISTRYKHTVSTGSWSR